MIEGERKCNSVCAFHGHIHECVTALDFPVAHEGLLKCTQKEAEVDSNFRAWYHRKKKKTANTKGRFLQIQHSHVYFPRSLDGSRRRIKKATTHLKGDKFVSESLYTHTEKIHCQSSWEICSKLFIMDIWPRCRTLTAQSSKTGNSITNPAMEGNSLLILTAHRFFSGNVKWYCWSCI